MANHFISFCSLSIIKTIIRNFYVVFHGQFGRKLSTAETHGHAQFLIVETANRIHNGKANIFSGDSHFGKTHIFKDNDKFFAAPSVSVAATAYFGSQDFCDMCQYGVASVMSVSIINFLEKIYITRRFESLVSSKPASLPNLFIT